MLPYKIVSKGFFYYLVIAVVLLYPIYSSGQQAQPSKGPQQAQIAPQPQPKPQEPQPQPQPQPAPQPKPQSASSPPPPSAGTVSPLSGGNVIQMNFDNIELRDLVRFVSNVMGKNFVFDENVVKGRVTILAPKNLSKDDVLRVFTTVVNYFGFAVVQTPEAYKIVRGADARGMAIEVLDNEKIDKLPPEDRVVTYVASLNYLDSNIMVGVLRPLMSRDAFLVSIAATNSLIMVDTASNVQRIKSILQDTDVPVSRQLSNIKIYHVQHTIAADLAKILQQLMLEGKKAQTPKEKIFITAHPASNSLLISAPGEDMKEIERIISEIDTLRPQVLVEAAIIEVTTKKGEEFGIEWLLGAKFDSSGKAAAGGYIEKGGPLVSVAGGIASSIKSGDPAAAAAAVGGLSGFNIGILGDTIKYMGNEYPGLGAFIRAVSTASNVNILSTPQILTMNNEEAEVKVGENRPYTTSTRVDTAGIPINSYDYRDVGITLKVKPSINKDGFVYLNIQQEITKVTQDIVQTGATSQIPAPTTLKRSTKTTVGVRDSQTVVISGLIQDNSDSGSSGIPFFNSIPVLGYLFGSKKKSYEKTNLLVFITPKIIYNSQQIEDITKAQKEVQDKAIKKDTIIKKEK